VTTKVVVLHVNNETIEEFESSFETEMGWIEQSGISLSEHYSIPEELSDVNHIEVVWLHRQIKETLDYLKETGDFTDISPTLEIELIKELHENHESIDQDIDWRVRDYLGLEG